MNKKEQEECAKLIGVDPSYLKDEKTAYKMMLRVEQDLEREVNDLKREAEISRLFAGDREKIKIMFVLNELSEPVTTDTLLKILKLDSKTVKKHLEVLENNYLVKRSPDRGSYEITALGQTNAKYYFEKINSKNNN